MERRLPRPSNPLSKNFKKKQETAERLIAAAKSLSDAAESWEKTSCKDTDQRIKIFDFQDPLLDSAEIFEFENHFFGGSTDQSRGQKILLEDESTGWIPANKFRKVKLAEFYRLDLQI